MKTKEIGKHVEELLRENLEDLGVEIKDKELAAMKSLSDSITDLAAKAVKGEDISAEAAHVKAAILNFGSTYHAMMIRHIEEFIEEAFGVVMKIVLSQLNLSR